MSSVDFDPTFVRGLKLLQSRAPESTQQLREILNEVMEQRRADLALKRNDSDESLESRASNSGSSSRLSKKDNSVESKKRELDRESVEKLKQDIAELSAEPPPVKRQKLELPAAPVKAIGEKVKNPGSTEANKDGKPRERLREIEEDIFFAPQSQFSSSSSGRAKEQREREERDKMAAAAKLQKERSSSSISKEKITVAAPPAAAAVLSSTNSDSDTEVSDGGSGGVSGGGGADTSLDEKEFELDLLSNLSCVICKTMTYTATNRLLECQDCHVLYHQECHKPPVTDDSINDPRFVWYCSTCSKNSKKIVAKPIPKKAVTKPTPSAVSRDSPVHGKSAIRSGSDSAVTLQPFKRIETPKLPAVTKEPGGGAVGATGAAATGARGLSGFASLAANLHSGKSTDSIPRTSATSSSVTKSEVRAPRPIETSKSTPSLHTLSTAKLPVGMVKVSGSPSNVVNLPSPSVKTDGTKVLSPSLAAIVPGVASTRPSAISASISASVKSTIGAISPTPSSLSTSKLTVTAATPGSSSAIPSTSSSKLAQSQSTLMNADKRLQQMKKKAAAKMVEKRTKFD